MPKFVQPTPEWIAFAKANPCPECGADPTSVTNEAVENIDMWNWGAPTRVGAVWRSEITCVNGHVTCGPERARFFDEPVRLW